MRQGTYAWGRGAAQALVMLLGACAADATSGGSSDATTAGDTTAGDTTTTTTTADTGAPDAADPDPEGTRYPIASATGVTDGTFETRPEAAFDGVVEQAVAAAAATEIFENIEEEPLLYKELDCETRLRRLEVHPPSDGPMLFHPVNYPDGGTGTVTVVGRRADIPFWYEITSKPFGADGAVVFGPEDLVNTGDYVAYGVTFTSDAPLLGTLQVAEVALFGYCAGPNAEIAWQTTEWQCTGVTCVAATNPGGTQTRTVTCARDTGGFAHPDLCEGEAPASEGDTCELACPYTLSYVGPRPFTYDNDSGWLHEGMAARRAGPLPSEVAYGTTVAAIEGKPCSVLTEKPATYFVAISCDEDEMGGTETLYCAFRCE